MTLDSSPTNYLQSPARERSPAECFLLDSGFARWDDAPSLFGFRILGCLMLAAVCDLSNPREKSFLLALAESSKDTAIAVQEGTFKGIRVNATTADLLRAQGCLLDRAFGALLKQVGSVT